LLISSASVVRQSCGEGTLISESNLILRAIRRYHFVWLARVNRQLPEIVHGIFTVYEKRPQVLQPAGVRNRFG
jgi:hypothetical protein